MVKTAKRPIVGLFLDRAIVNKSKLKKTKFNCRYRLNRLVEAAAAANVELVVFSVDDGANRKTVNKAFINPMLYARYLYSLSR